MAILFLKSTPHKTYIRARISSKNLLVRRTSRFTKPLVRNEIHLSVIKSTFLVSSMKIIKSNVYLMLRPNIVLRCRLSSTYIIINIIIKSSVGFLPGRKVFLPHEGEKHGRKYFCHSFCHFCRGEMAEIIKTFIK